MTEPTNRHFIQQAIDAHIAEGRFGPPGERSVVRTRFPPEPNGFLHIGHAKALSTNVNLAREFGGSFVLRFDDTNPTKEEQAYVDAIIDDVRWLGYAWEGASDDDRYAGVRFASGYFQQMADWARELIDMGLAYVDEQTPEQIREGRGSVGTPGTPGPYRDRPAEESRRRFNEMARGEHPDGSMVLRAKIDMAAPNMNLRDPVMYRVLNATHHRTANAWHVYPMYDWAHGLEDSIEGVTHSLCSLEFEDHRPLYDWFLSAINRDRSEKIHHPQQIEFARLNPTYLITSKRKLKQLIDDGHVEGWDDPRMPTISGLRRRGYTPKAIRDFCTSVGVTKFPAKHDVALLENAVREHLNAVAPRRMCVLDPLKVTITNWADHGEADRTEWLPAVNNPENKADGTRDIPFTGTLYIERGDFMEDAPRKFFRLKPGSEVRLRYGYWITCTDVVKDSLGNVEELKCTYDPKTRGGDSPPPDDEGKVRKVKGTLHWVSADHAVECDVRLFDRLFTEPEPGKRTGDPIDDLNPDDLTTLNHARLEPNWNTKGVGPDWPDGIVRVQFERHGYFCLDADTGEARPVWNRTVPLRDSWAKQAGK